jgi:PAS domain S-box-containing protein
MVISGLDTDGLLQLQQRILAAIVRRIPLREVLDDLCRLVEEGLEDTVCSIMRLDPTSGSLVVRAGPCVPPELAERLDGLVPADLAGSCGSAVHTGEMQITEDTRTDPRWASMRDVAEQYGIRSCWSIPVFAGDGEVLGSFAISHMVRRAPDDQDLRLLRTAGHLVGIAIERDRSEEALRDQKALLSSILESAEDPVFAKDSEGRYLTLNTATAESADASVDEMIGRDDAAFFPAEVARRIRETEERVLASGEGVHYEDEVDHSAIGPRRYLIRKNPLRSASGSTVGVVGIARDVTELRRTEEALQLAQKLESLGVLAGGIAHDFNNLLTGILGHAEVAKTRLTEDSPIEGNLQQIVKAAERASELIDQMLAYSGRADLAKTVLSVPDLVEDVHSLLVSSISKKAELVFSFASDVPNVEGDATQLRQVAMNLITNASESLDGRAGRIDVSVKTQSLAEVRRAGLDELEADEFVMLQVADSGEGMDPATQARIFDPFFTTKFTGRGLGLAAVQGIVRGHDGWIGVRSRPGSGTVFTVLLPATRRAATANGKVAEAEVAPTDVCGTVLVVDDEEAVRGLAEDVLDSAGFRTLLAVDGLDAVELLGRTDGQVDAVLLDFTTPRLGGREAFQGLRGVRQDVPVILCSGFDEREVLREFVPGELAGFVKKPFRPAELVAKIQAAVHSRRG